MKVSFIQTPLGTMVAAADDQAVRLLEFFDSCQADKYVELVGNQLKTRIAFEPSNPVEQIGKELEAYFAGRLQGFKTPLVPFGSSFQQQVWKELQTIPIGETRSYVEIATAVGKPFAYRAVGAANGKNPIAIAIPCHRVIHRGGGLGGYSGGIERKEWLLRHEKNA